MPVKKTTAFSSKRRDDNLGNCVTPPRFYATGVEVDFANNPLRFHTIHYDSVSGWVKWNRNNTALGGSHDITDLWNLTLSAQGYTPQFVMGVSGPQTCVMYGGDTFYPWAYGPNNGMQWVRNETHPYPNHTTVKYQSRGAMFDFEAKVEDGSPFCLPGGWRHNNNEVRLDSIAVAEFPEGTFDVPSICKPKDYPDGGCWAHRIRSNHN
eukprot:PhM_4_TR3834/c0_g1_i1/m.96397